MLQVMNHTSFANKKVIISGSGNVALYAMQKAQELGATVIAMSDSSGYIYNENGLNFEILKDLKEVKRARISEYLTFDNTTILKHLLKIYGKLNVTSLYLVLPKMNLI